MLVSDALTSAINTVEKTHKKPFLQTPTITLAASEESFVRLTGHDVEAASLPNGVYLSPYLLRYPKRVPGVLTHELSHLHLRQYIGSIKLGRLPLWFVEGLATLTAQGGGAMDVSDDDAKQALATGNYSKPAYKRGLLFDQLVMTPHERSRLFYRQSMLFMRFLKNENPVAFDSFLSDVLSGQKLRLTFNSRFQSSLDNLWQKFVDRFSK